MVVIPVSKPARAKAIAILAGIASVAVAHFLPAQYGLLHDLLQVLGIGGIGVGTAQIVKAPS